jgi:hypothetical protein
MTIRKIISRNNQTRSAHPASSSKKEKTIHLKVNGKDAEVTSNSKKMMLKIKGAEEIKNKGIIITNPKSLESSSHENQGAVLKRKATVMVTAPAPELNRKMLKVRIEGLLSNKNIVPETKVEKKNIEMNDKTEKLLMKMNEEYGITDETIKTINPKSAEFSGHKTNMDESKEKRTWSDLSGNQKKVVIEELFSNKNDFLGVFADTQHHLFREYRKLF